jgi:DNA mismatch endonuclease (patch repair protein)
MPGPLICVIDSSAVMTTLQRSLLMKRVGRKDTGPELAVRRYLHADGLRFRLHVRTLPGTPDIVLPRHRAIVFVHGCFWHGHSCKHGLVRAKTNSRFWDEKIAANRARDRRKARALTVLGWKVITIWECRCHDSAALAALCTAIRIRAVRGQRQPKPKHRPNRSDL